jgi:hypothetical protein
MIFVCRSASLRDGLHPSTRKARVPGTPGLRRKEGFLACYLCSFQPVLTDRDAQQIGVRLADY